MKFNGKNAPLLIGGLVILAAVVMAALALPGLLFGGMPTADASVRDINPAEYQAQFDESQPHLLLDVRTPEEFAEGHIPGAVNISVQTLGQRLAEVPQDVPVVIYCRSGNRSAAAASLLAQAGYTDIYDMGGIIDWAVAGLPVES